MKFTVDSQVPVDPKISSAKYHFRSEFSEWPWNINLTEGTEQWAGWSYYFMPDYVRSVNPISIFQNHAASSWPDPAFQLELTRPGQLPGALGGEIQVINDCSSPTVRKMTSFRPNPGDRIDIVLHVVHARDNNGLLEFWINGVKVHSQIGSTIYPAPENWGGNNKWGIYHHTWTDPTSVLLDIAARHTKFELLMGNLRQITRGPSDPNYRTDSRAVVDPTQDAAALGNVKSINPTTSASLTASASEPKASNAENTSNEIEFTASPVPVRRGEDITIRSNSTEPFEALMMTMGGQRLTQFTSTESAVIQTTDFVPGIYLIQFSQEGKTITKRVMILD